MTSFNIKQYLKSKKDATGHELSNALHLTDRAIRKQLSNLLRKGEVVKIGKPPKVYYSLSDTMPRTTPPHQLESKTINFINQNYLYISPSGERIHK